MHLDKKNLMSQMAQTNNLWKHKMVHVIIKNNMSDNNYQKKCNYKLFHTSNLSAIERKALKPLYSASTLCIISS